MLAQTFLLPVLALAGAVAASPQNSQPTLCAQPTATITNAADANALAACTTISGSIVVSSDAAGAIDISGPKEVQGDIIANNVTHLTELSSSTIQTIGGTFNLNGLTILSSLSFTKLTSVKNIAFVALQGISQLNFPATVSQASSVLIENTILQNLDGINLDTVDVMNINNNLHLTTFSTQVSSVSQSLSVAFNGLNLNVELPNLLWATNASFQDVSSVSIPSLTVVNSSLSFNNNTLTGFSAPNLTTIGDSKTGVGSFTFDSNKGVKNLTFPALTSIAGANEIGSNVGLTNINFPVLTFVGGAVNFTGNFTTPGLSALKTVKGGFYLASSGTLDCTPFQNENSPSGVIEGNFYCKGDLTNVQPVTTGTSTGSSSSASATQSKNAAVSYGINEAVASLSVVGGLLQMLL